jgi:hypothetical protein
VLKDECQRGCLATQDMRLQVTNDELRIRATVSSDGAQAWPIPGPASEFVPEKVLLDGADTTRMRRDSAGMLFVRVPDGTHVVEVFGRTPRRSVFTLQLTMSPGHMTAALEGWTADGILPLGGTVGSVQLTRVASTTTETAEVVGVENEESRFADYFHISREFELGVEWRGTVRVSRIGDLSRPAGLSVPLLVDERMVSGVGEEQAGAVKLSFARGVGSVTFTTKLEPRDEVVMEAADGSRFAEQWTFACSSLLECLPRSELPISQSKSGDGRVLRYDPFPGEKAVVRIVKPAAASGETIVIDAATLNYRPSKRETDVTSEFRIRNSKTDTFTFELPDTATVSRVYVDGAERPLERSGRISSITLTPAPDEPHTVVVEWRDSAALKFNGAMPGMKISGNGVNADIKVQIPEDRWLLAARGPAWGPAILFWGKLIVVLLLSIGIAKTKVTPLSFAAIVFLGLGLASLSVWEIAFVLLWFAALHFRKQLVPERGWVFNLMQLGIVVLSFLALSALFEATRAGLILKPDMQVSGSSSSNALLRWYVDRFDGELPSVSVYSLPLSVWRGFMLLWSVWLATSLLGWMRWGWQSFSHEGLWRKRVAKKAAEKAM